MKIDELAHKAGIPSRTIRYYTEQGLLPSPEVNGRIGHYSEEHLERLLLIKELKERHFLPLAVIRGIVKRSAAGGNLDAMLGPLDLIFVPHWDATTEGGFTRDELAERAGVPHSVVGAAEDMGWLFPQRQGRRRLYSSEDVEVVKLAAEWTDLAIPRELGRQYRRSFEKISMLQVQAFTERAFELEERELAGEELQAEIVRIYRARSRAFARLASLLHRRLLREAVTSFVSSLERRHSESTAESEPGNADERSSSAS